MEELIIRNAFRARELDEAVSEVQPEMESVVIIALIAFKERFCCAKIIAKGLVSKTAVKSSSLKENDQASEKRENAYARIMIIY